MSTQPSTSGKIPRAGVSRTQRRPRTPQFWRRSTFNRRRPSQHSPTTCQLPSRGPSSALASLPSSNNTPDASSSTSAGACSAAAGPGRPQGLGSTSSSTPPKRMRRAFMRLECVTRTQLSSTSSSSSRLHSFCKRASTSASDSGSSLHHRWAQSEESTRSRSPGRSCPICMARSTMCAPTPVPRQSRSRMKLKRSRASFSSLMRPQPSSDGSTRCAVCSARSRGEQ
mmetsp:Transcript_86794/g.245767  ORF Transcript_86794/g.245767 Transcript_86794/m.245767 type:complete len:226 (+) Transcript_86794:176-853(+)